MRHRIRENGQASVEYLLVGLVLISLMGALAALWHSIAQGDFTSLIQQGASHALDSGGGAFDAFLF